jgi:2-C-methyl-D-erythritol 4-phosphate cytidylyltransferase
LGSVWAVIVAAGEGRRFGRQKQFDRLRGRLVVEWSIDAARSCVDGVVLVVPAEHLEDAAMHGEADVIVSGGVTRSQSVRNGIAAIPGEADVIVIHDAARPLASAELFAAVVAKVKAGNAAVIPGAAVTDTIKRVDREKVTETLDRSVLVTVQTPQAFDAATLRRAHESGGEATDDAALVEAMGGEVVVVPGEITNKKITDLADLELFEALIRAMEPR